MYLLITTTNPNIPKQKSARNGALNTGRGERIRTSGPCLPKAVLYQAELHPEFNVFC